MLERQTEAQGSQESAQAESNEMANMTQLEGIRQKVFIDRYSLKDASGNALELYPEQLWARVARGIAEVEKTPEARAAWERKFYDALADFQFVPGGRILAGAGSGHAVTYYNCMPPDQEVLTANGYRPISEINIGDLVVTHRNRLRPVLHKFERETAETLYVIHPKKVGYDELRLTGEHKVYVIRSEWINTHRSRDGLRLQQEPGWIPAKDIQPGDYVALGYNGEERPAENIKLLDYLPGYEVEDGKLFKKTTRGDHGYVSDGGTHYKFHNQLVLDKDLCYLFGRWLGDGCVTHRTGSDIPSGIKIVFSLEENEEAVEVARIVEEKFGIDGSIKLSSTGRWYDLWVNSMPLGQFFKAFLGCYSYDKCIPEQLMHLPAELTLALLYGLFSADGYISDNKLGIVLANRELTIQIHQLLLRLGYLFAIRENTHRLGRVPAYRVQATATECAPLFDRFFGVQAPEHDIDLKYYFEYDNLKWVRIHEIAVEDYSGVVMDMEVEEDHSFVSAGVVVSNCFVIPSPEDSRQGILDNLKTMTEIMARGGGVGINLSSLRPRGSYIRTVNGTASGPCSWAQLYSVATGDVIQQGGCFGPDERIATDRGLIPVKELVARLENGEKIRAQTHKGLRPFTYVFHNGKKDLYEVTTSRGYKTRVTHDHKMGVLRNGKITTVPLRELNKGDEILLLIGDAHQNGAAPVALKASPYVRSKMSTTLNENVVLPKELAPELAYLLGFFYGDGYVIQGKKVTWRDEKGISMTVEDTRPEIVERLSESIKNLFGLEPKISAGDGACITISIYSRVLVEWLQENGLLKQKAALVRAPEAIFQSPAEVVSAFISGFFDADGCDRGSKGGYGIDSVSREMLEDLQILLLNHGILSHITTQDRSNKENWLNIHRLIISGAHFRERFSAFITCFKNTERQGKRSHFSNYPMEVWDALEIPGRYYQGLFDSTKERVSHYALTRVRERVAAKGAVALLENLDALFSVLPDKIVSIEALGTSEVYDFEVDDVHLLAGGGLYTSNSRRGALMLMLDDDHPDIEEFITVKKTAGKIEHANLSVCISDRFMQAVKEDADWNLVWQGEIKKTIRARQLWDLICTSAWASAEPGMVFMDRYNKLSNTWYYENIRCVNPCVTGDTLVSTEQGYIPARDLRIGMNVRTPAGLKPIEKMYNNGVQHIYRANFSDGGYLKGTADHKVKVVRGKKYEWVPFSELKEGEKVLVVANEAFGPRQNLPEEAMAYIAKRQLNVANYYDRKLGLIVGTIVGDGTLRELPNLRSHSYQCKVAFGAHEDEWFHTFNSLMTDMNIHTLRQISEKEFAVGGGNVAVKHRSVRLECYKLASLLIRIGMIPNIKAPQKTIPLTFMGMEKEFLAGILDGLFSTDGSVLMKQDNPMLRFHTSSNALAQQVRLILLQFGIHARIYRATRDEDLMYDGRSMYGTGEKFDVIIMNEGIARFYAEIGLSHPEKAARLKDVATNWHYIGGTWTASVVSIADTGAEEEVYDLYEPETLTWITNGYCSLDCGEQGLPAFGVCNLGAINLSSFVQNGQMDYERLAEKTKVAMRFLDNVVDATEYFIPENAEAQLGTRRTGLGTMGLADALIKMKIAYGSDESVPVIEKIYATIRDAAYEASADYAAEKGAFPRFEREKYMQGHFIKQLPKAIQEKIKQNGTRNAVLLTQAPTGTTSLLSGVSSGIEPVYDFAMIRRDRTGEHILYHPLLQAWRDEHPNEPTPAYFVSSKDLTPEEHVRVQATIQKYTDSSISKCVVGDTLVSSERGLLPIADLYVGEQPDTFRSLALHVASLKGTQLASHFYFGGIKPTQRVKLADGHEITGTPNHQLYVGTPEGLVWKRLDELLPGDYVSLKIGAQLFGTDVPLHGFQQSTIRSGYQKTISVPASMNPVLAHFIGSYIAEGCIVHYTVRITNNEESVLERLREECRMLFGLDGNIIPQGKNNALTLQINSKSLCELLRFLGCEGLAAQKTIPWSILQSSRESIVAFLSGLYLDGFITDTKVGICLASQKLIQQLQIVFDNLGVQSWITVRHNVQYNRDYYELNAHGQEAQRILRLLTLDETHKRERALKLLQREFQNNKSDVLPIEARKSLFADASRTVRYRHHSYSQALPQDRKEKMLSWFGLRRLANDPEVQLTPSLQEIWQESLHFRRVIAVENSGEQPVYDLSVPSTTAFIGNGIVNHNTVNAPNDHTVEQVQKLYRLAYEMGCKGITYYRDGSRDAVLTRIEDEKKTEKKAEEHGVMLEPVNSIQQGIKPRPPVVQGYTRQVNAPEGKINVTINSDEHGPLEVFVNVGKAGSDIAALAEALGRLISLNLRVLSPLSQVDRVKEIAEQLRGIGGSRSVGFGAQQVRSMPDAVARALELHMDTLEEQATQQALPTQESNGHRQSQQADPEAAEASLLTLSRLNVTGNLCPECGCNTMVYEEGCKKCYSCGHSEC